jgi:pimeloyl-ACP methyl ester carboxylesterase
VVRVNGVNLAYLDEGQGDPIILVHGFPLDGTMWDDQVRALSGNHRVIVPDLRGHGASESIAGPYSMDMLADDLKGLLDHLNVDEVTLGGFSMGGYVAFAFYRKYKKRVNAMILAGTRPQSDSATAAESRESMAQRAESEGQDSIATAMLPRLLTSETLEDRSDIAARVRGMMTKVSVQGIAGDLRAMAARVDSTETLGQMTVPTLVIVGEEDALAPPTDSEMMARELPDASLQIIPGGGHLVNIENPDTYNFQLLVFLESL